MRKHGNLLFAKIRGKTFSVTRPEAKLWSGNIQHAIIYDVDIWIAFSFGAGVSLLHRITNVVLNSIVNMINILSTFEKDFLVVVSGSSLSNHGQQK